MIDYKQVAETLLALPSVKAPGLSHLETNLAIAVAIELCEQMARGELVERSEVGRIAAACADFDEASR